MIPRSTTLTDQGRSLRGRLLWGVGAVVALVALAFAFIALDRSTVVEGPAGSSFATTATGVAAVHDTFAREGRQPRRLQAPLSSSVLAPIDTYVVSDVEFARYDDAELLTLESFVTGGGTAVILGIPPRALLDRFDLEIAWSGGALGDVPVRVPIPDATTIRGSRFGSFDRQHSGEALAGSAERDLAVRFARGDGSVVLVADSSVAHNATVDQTDNIDFLGGVIGDRPGFDEYRHGYDDTPATGLLSAAPGNWPGALAVGGVALMLALISYGRRFGPVEPAERDLVPDRATYVDAVARSLRRAGGEIPSDPLRAAVLSRLRLSPDADRGSIVDAARHQGLAPELVDELARGGSEDARVLDRALASLSTRRGSSR